MKNQVKRGFALKKKLRPIYSSSSPYPPFSHHAFGTPNNSGGGSSSRSGSGNANSSTESTTLMTYQVVQTDDLINYNVDDAEEEYFNSFPPGYRFKPRDDEFIVHYLKPKISNQVLPLNRIKDVQLYKYNPETLAAKYKANGENENEWYFFTPRDRKYPNGYRPNRAAGDGFWKASGADQEIRFNGNTVGWRKTLVFFSGKPSKGEKTDWIMHEYKLDNPPKRTKISQNDMKLDDWILCKIRKKDQKDKSVKAASGSQGASSEPSLPSENVSSSSSVPIITGATEDSDLVHYNYSEISESSHVPFHGDQASPYAQQMINVGVAFDQDQASPYAQQMINFGGNNNFVPLIDNTASASILYQHTAWQIPYDHCWMESTGTGFITNELDELVYNFPDEPDSENSKNI